MYESRFDMGITEFAIKRAIKELSEEREKFTQQDIADYIPCSIRTVEAVCSKLQKARLLAKRPLFCFLYCWGAFLFFVLLFYLGYGMDEVMM